MFKNLIRNKKSLIIIFIILIGFVFSLIINQFIQIKKFNDLPISIKNFYSLYNFYQTYDFSTKNNIPNFGLEKKFKEELSTKFKDIFTEPALSRFNDAIRNESIYSSFFNVFFLDFNFDKIYKVVNKNNIYTLFLKRQIISSYGFGNNEGIFNTSSIIKDFNVNNMGQKTFNKLTTESTIIVLNIYEKDIFYLNPNKNGKLLIRNIKIEYLNSRIKLINQK